MSLRIVPVTLAEAKQFVAAWHRHLPPKIQTVFQLGCADADDVLRGVAMVGWPVARHFADGLTLEVNRTATDGTTNANSMLYGAAWRAARALGYRRLITYTQHGETGASLRGAGWVVVGERPSRGGWQSPSRPDRSDRAAMIPRTLWEATA